MPMPFYTVLVIDDAPEDRAALRRALNEAVACTCRVLEAEDGASGLQQWREQHPDCVLLDYSLPDTVDLELLDALVADARGVAPVILVTGIAQAPIAVAALQHGAQDYVTKAAVAPLSLQLAIVNAVTKTQLRRADARASAELQASAARYRALVEATTDWIWRADAQGQALGPPHDLAAERSSATADLPAVAAGSRLHPDDRARVVASWTTAIALQQSYEDTFRAQAADGSLRIVEARAVPIRDHMGQVREWVGTTTDITARRMAEDALRATASRLRLFERVALNIRDALLITEAEPVDLPGPRIVYVNPAFERMTGYRADEVLGQTPRLLQGPLTDRSELDRIRVALKRWKSVQVQLTNYRKDGTPFDVEFEIVPVADETGWFIYWVSVQRDITARKQAEAERARLLAEAEQARAVAEAAVTLRDQFLSVAAHELQNPLASLLGYTTILRRRLEHAAAFSDRDRKTFAALHAQGMRLNEQITQLLDVSRIELGQLRITRAVLDLTALVRRCVDEMQLTLTQHTLVATLPAAPLIIDGDALRLEQVLHNLLGNAVKYSPQGGAIRVHLEQRGAAAWLAVQDQGIGIPPAALSRLFQRFFRAENAVAQAISGTGIGLYVVREIVMHHGGDVAVESTEGQGSTVRLWLPLLEPAVGSVEAAPPAD